MGDWTEAEVKRFIRREAVFKAEGYEDSVRLAEQMLNRDRDPMDDRRLCFECAHLNGRKCSATSLAPALRFVLQRCDHFKLKGQK